MEDKMTEENLSKEICIGICQKTGKSVLMAFDEKEEHWICLHKDTREEELKEIKDFLKKYN